MRNRRNGIWSNVQVQCCVVGTEEEVLSAYVPLELAVRRSFVAATGTRFDIFRGYLKVGGRILDCCNCN